MSIDLLLRTFMSEAGDADGGGSAASDAGAGGGTDDGAGAGDEAKVGDDESTTLAGGDDLDAGDVSAGTAKEAPKPDDSTTIAGGEDGDDDGGEKPGEKASGEGEDEKSGAPEGDYSDFTLPENFSGFDQASLESFTGVAKELGIDQAGAQKLVDVAAEHAMRIETRVQDEIERAFQAQQVSWAKEFAEHPIMGGENQRASVRAIRAGLNALAGDAAPQVRAWLNDTRLGNHPMLCAMFYQAGQWVSDDKVLAGGHGGRVDAAQQMFPTMAKELEKKS